MAVEDNPLSSTGTAPTATPRPCPGQEQRYQQGTGSAVNSTKVPGKVPGQGSSPSAHGWQKAAACPGRGEGAWGRAQRPAVHPHHPLPSCISTGTGTTAAGGQQNKETSLLLAFPQQGTGLHPRLWMPSCRTGQNPAPVCLWAAGTGPRTAPALFHHTKLPVLPPRSRPSPPCHPPGAHPQLLPLPA